MVKLSLLFESCFMVKFIFKGAQTVTVPTQELWMGYFFKMLFEIFFMHSFKVRREYVFEQVR